MVRFGPLTPTDTYSGRHATYGTDPRPWSAVQPHTPISNADIVLYNGALHGLEAAFEKHKASPPATPEACAVAAAPQAPN